MGLQGVLVKDPSTGMFMADRIRARKALVSWLDRLAEGEVTVSLKDVARAEGLSPGRMKKILRDDKELQKDVFGGLNEEAQLGLAKAMARGMTYLEDKGTDPKEVRMWGEFFAKFIGGAYEKQNREGGGGGLLALIANIQLPPGFRGEVKTIPYKEVESELGGLLPDGLKERPA